MRIAVLSDGTGNSAAKVWRTNIWRTYERIDLADGDQIAYYDDGVGSSPFAPFALIGGAFGYGLKRNVLACYRFICRNYKMDDELYLFGFSRGAYTIRVLLDLISREGLVRYDGSEEHLAREAELAYRRFQASLPNNSMFVWFRRIQRSFAKTRPATGLKPAVRFVGLWDTVAAYGLPFEELTEIYSRWVYPLRLTSNLVPENVVRVCHALSLDDERTTFKPLVLAEAPQAAHADGLGGRTSDERISQVWFAGVHANVGGGYPDDSMSDVSLRWMLSEARTTGLRFSEPCDPRSAVGSTRRAIHGRAYDSRSGLAGYYRYSPRPVALLYPADDAGAHGLSVSATPKIHHTVFRRVFSSVQSYAPVNIPSRYNLVQDDGELVSNRFNPFESEVESTERVMHLESAWNSVYRRQIVYNLIVFVTVALLLFPLFDVSVPADEFSSRWAWASQAIRFLGSLIPFNLFRAYVDSFSRNPLSFLILSGALAMLLAVNSSLKTRISDLARSAWDPQLRRQNGLPRPGLLYFLRKSYGMSFVQRILLKKLIPTWVVLSTVVGIAAVANHVVFNIVDAAGLICNPSQEAALRTVGLKTEEPPPFRNSELCWRSGLVVKAGTRYLITIRQIGDWQDGANVMGLSGGKLKDAESPISKFVTTSTAILRRTLTAPQFAPILRVGQIGSQEFHYTPDDSGDREVTYVFKPSRDGELFLYVNDAVLAWPGLTDFFYRNNLGEAQVSIRRRQ